MPPNIRKSRLKPPRRCPLSTHPSRYVLASVLLIRNHLDATGSSSTTKPDTVLEASQRPKPRVHGIGGCTIGILPVTLNIRFNTLHPYFERQWKI